MRCSRLAWRLSFAVALLLAASAMAQPVPRAIRLQLAVGMPDLTIKTTAPMSVSADSAELLSPGTYNLTVTNPKPSTEQFHLFSKTFEVSETAEEAAYVRDWTEKGYTPIAMEMGRTYTTAKGAVLDNRIRWISLARFPTEAAAKEKQRALQSESVWAWIRREQIAMGTGTAVITNATGVRVFEGTIPVSLESSEAFATTIPDGDRMLTGNLQVRVESDGKIALYESTGLEDYIAGVLPAEMPALWPLEALKAQAVAARSDVLAHLNLKHALEGFDYTTNEANRVYKGHGGRHANTDAAVAATSGEVISQGGRIVPAVFSANCGGYSEDNDSVWSAPADPLLRARADFPAGANPVPNGPAAYGLSKWLTTSPAAYCRDDGKFFRWRRTLTVQELSASINKEHAIGTLRSIETGDRGPGGRLKWVKVSGTAGSATIYKEYPIRLALGGLPSAAFIVDTSSTDATAKSFTFIGGGRGHGVGLCQYGARGMASDGAECHQILRQYYSHVDIERVE